MSEQKHYCGIANTYCATVTGLKTENDALRVEIEDWRKAYSHLKTDYDILGLGDDKVLELMRRYKRVGIIDRLDALLTAEEQEDE